MNDQKHNGPAGARLPKYRKSLLQRFGPLVVLAIAIASAYLTGMHHYIGFEKLAAHRETIILLVKNHFWASVAGYCLLYILITALSLPAGAFLTILGGFLFGPVIGGTATVAAATIGALLIFFIVRTSLGETLAARAGPFVEKLRHGFGQNAIFYMFFLRLVPVFPFWLVNIAPALLGVGGMTYFIGTFFGIMPATYTFSYIGSGLGSVIEAQGRAYDNCVNRNDSEGISPADSGCRISLNPGDLVTPELLAAFAALGLIALLPVIVKKIRNS